MSPRRLLPLLAILLIAAALLAACVDDGVARFTVEGTDNKTFKPDVITVNSGQTVELTLVNYGKLGHSFSIPDLMIEVQMRPGKPETLTFTAPAPGEYRIISGAIQDLDKMTAKLIVK